MRTVTIQFINGDKVSLEIPQQDVDTNRWTQYIERMYSQQYVVFEAEGAMLMYPVQNIRSIQVFPAPERLPDFCLRGSKVSG